MGKVEKFFDLQCRIWILLKHLCFFRCCGTEKWKKTVFWGNSNVDWQPFRAHLEGYLSPWFTIKRRLNYPQCALLLRWKMMKKHLRWSESYFSVSFLVPEKMLNIELHSLYWHDFDQNGFGTDIACMGKRDPGIYLFRIFSFQLAYLDCTSFDVNQGSNLTLFVRQTALSELCLTWVSRRMWIKALTAVSYSARSANRIKCSYFRNHSKLAKGMWVSARRVLVRASKATHLVVWTNPSTMTY